MAPAATHDEYHQDDTRFNWSGTTATDLGGVRSGQRDDYQEDAYDGVSFGGGTNVWHFSPTTKLFDLSRGSSRKLTIDADVGISTHRGLTINPAKTVLVVIDMQNYFIHPDCRDHAGGLAAVNPTLKVVQKCRDEGIQIAWLNWGIDEHDLRVMPPAVQRGFCQKLAATQGYGWHIGLGAQLPDDQGRCLWKGSWNARLYDPFWAVSRAEDCYFDKSRPSGMYHESLPLCRYMNDNEMTTMLFCGVNTDQCVNTTLTDSYHKEFDCIMLEDCCGTMTGYGAADWVKYNAAQNYGFVSDSKAFLNARHT